MTYFLRVLVLVQAQGWPLPLPLLIGIQVLLKIYNNFTTLSVNYRSNPLFEGDVIMNLLSFFFYAGGEEGRQTGWSANDPRRRVSGPILSAGSLSKQKNPVASEMSVSKDAMVSCF